MIFSLILTFLGDPPDFKRRAPVRVRALFGLGALLDAGLLVEDFFAVALAVTECRVLGRTGRAGDLAGGKCLDEDGAEVVCFEILEGFLLGTLAGAAALNLIAFFTAVAFFALPRDAGRIAPEPFVEALECILIGMTF